MSKKSCGRYSKLEEIFSEKVKRPLEDYPKVSILIPTCNCAQLIEQTLDSLLHQNYPFYEIVIIDASNDRTEQAIKSYRSEKIRFYSMAAKNRYERINKGIAFATGEYINILFPGDFYLYRETLQIIMDVALDNEKPDLVYCGTLLREGGENVKTLLRPYDLSMIKKGLQPTSLQSCWFKQEVFKILGRFDTSYQLRGGLDFLSRFYLYDKFKMFHCQRVLVDYEARPFQHHAIVTHFFETMRTIYKYFGFFGVMRWLFFQRDTSQLARIYFKTIKKAMLGR